MTLFHTLKNRRRTPDTQLGRERALCAPLISSTPLSAPTHLPPGPDFHDSWLRGRPQIEINRDQNLKKVAGWVCGGVEEEERFLSLFVSFGDVLYFCFSSDFAGGKKERHSLGSSSSFSSYSSFSYSPITCPLYSPPSAELSDPFDPNPLSLSPPSSSFSSSSPRSPLSFLPSHSTYIGSISTSKNFVTITNIVSPLGSYFFFLFFFFIFFFF